MLYSYTYWREATINDKTVGKAYITEIASSHPVTHHKGEIVHLPSYLDGEFIFREWMVVKLGEVIVNKDSTITKTNIIVELKE